MTTFFFTHTFLVQILVVVIDGGVGLVNYNLSLVKVFTIDYHPCLLCIVVLKWLLPQLLSGPWS